MARLDIFWSFRSPYSWLAMDRLVAIVREYDVEARFRPVRPLALREPDFFERARPQFLPYLMKDVFREAERLGIAFAPPRPDPVAMDMASGEVAPEQPLMETLMRLAVAAVERGRGLDFARAVAARIWGGTENWQARARLAEAAGEAGLALEDLETWAAQNPDRIAEEIAANEADQLRHHWGVPLMVLDDEPFFGQDRIDSLRWRLDRRGLRRD
ncbi:DsbA family protein [Amphiplicatus metriothermophilus]|uniref:2-hydroxychromene-2-carboxylate isomerase n=1 Tax=Amphiplicatus metriothermophilus TaxID=1519374 RepID=A0A239PKD6_9PROT|nr:DsbA family protein [Amphiplicatus metriothermophilus]MBB5517383.1 2-hydroxychromene-2-carboxylate isomerase [Amphiplicatus metriothermophilus]SNT68282.1 2-hydroxychromene-2-carboxylate isomerase [Amphiplicatus metriothermophilus]